MWPAFAGLGFARWFGSAREAPNLPVDNPVQIGDRFFELNPPNRLWTVERFVVPRSCDIPHVVISRDRSTTTKIVSVAILSDERFYGRDRRLDEKTAPGPARRRKEDLPQG